MLKHIDVFIITLFLILTAGCSLDITPSNDYTEEVIWNNSDNIELYINELYTTLRDFQFDKMANLIGDGNATDALTDLMKYTSVTPGKGTVNELATNPSVISPATPVMDYWSTGYTKIRRINEFIDGVTRNTSYLEENVRMEYIAQARFLRGYIYFWLVKLHGSILLLNDIEDYLVVDRQRSTETECWDAVINDFSFAAEWLPTSWNSKNKGKITRIAAYSMVARASLYAGSIAKYDRKQFNFDELTGVAESKAKEYFEKSIKATEEAIKLSAESGISLENNLEKIFTNESSEIILASYFVSPFVRHSYDIMYAPPGDSNEEKCWVRGVPTAELADEFEMSDGAKFDWNNPEMAANPYKNREPRFYSTILYNGATWKGRDIITIAGSEREGYVEFGNNPNSDEPKRTVTGYYVKKMLDPSNTTFVDDGSFQPWIEIRYAELLLIAAEAETYIDSQMSKSKARNYLNLLRVNRGLPEFVGDDLLSAIKHERIVELAFEGHRYWDLRRWREAHILLNNTMFHACRITDVQGELQYEKTPCDDRQRKFYTSMYYMPVPSTEIRNNQLITQIKGW